jgi:glutamine synthetase
VRGPAERHTAYIDYFAGVKRQEFLAWPSVVTDWEVERYLTLF